MVYYQDLTNKRFGNLVCIKLSNMLDSNNTTKLWECKCDCGKTTYKSARVLNESKKLNKQIDCGCNLKKYIGVKFGDYNVIGFYKSINKQRYYKCKCVCGYETIKSSYQLSKLKNYICIKSQMQNTKIRISLKSILEHIIKRCYDINNKSYKYYGGRGIKVCEDWLNNKMNFVEWSLLNGYKKGLTIDRINNDGNYEPINCRWVDKFVQANNKRNNINITFNDKTQSLKQWCRELQLPYRKTHKRIKKYLWTIEKAFDISQRTGFINK